MVKIDSDWKPFFEIETQKEYYKELREFLKAEYKTKTVYPHMDNIFNAFRLTNINDTKVIILGQDPYHGAGQAIGLSFAVPEETKIPPSLLNIIKEIIDDIGATKTKASNLKQWTEQGVFLLNSCLTVCEGQANSHSGKGWETLTDNAIKLLNQHDNPKVFMLWGAFARKKKEFITNPKHLVLESTHPSPLSAYNGFFGCKHFSKANKFLIENSIIPIEW